LRVGGIRGRSGERGKDREACELEHSHSMIQIPGEQQCGNH
jgi:hypothetical protein